MKRIKTNVYGPRPKDGGFRCRECGTQEVPLFGFAEAGKKDPESNTNTSCAPCLTNLRLKGSSFTPTEDALAALEASGYSSTTDTRRVLVKRAKG